MNHKSSLSESKFFQSAYRNSFRMIAIDYFNFYGFKFTEEDIQEVISEAGLRIAMNMDKYDESLSKSSWFTTITRNCACDYMKKEGAWRARHQRFEAVDDDGECYEHEYASVDCCDSYEADAQLISNEHIAIIENELYSLGKDGATALSMKAQGYSNEDICDILGVSDGACRVIISRARRKLKNNREIQRIYSDVIGRDICEVE